MTTTSAEVEVTIYPPAGTVPWLLQAVELEGLAQVAQAGAWTAAEAARAAVLVGELTELMSSAPVDPPPVYPEPLPPDPPMVDETGKLKRAKYPVGAARTLSATDATLLDVVNNKAQPGDHVACEGGGYDREYAFTKAFPPDRPVVIRSKVPLEANFSKQIKLRAPGYFLHELRSSFSVAKTPSILLDASNLTVTRCWLQGTEGIHGAKKAIGNIQIGWCRFTGQNRTTLSANHIFMWLPLAGRYSKPTDGPYNMSIHYNFFDDPASKAGEDHNIYFGDTKCGPNDWPKMQDVYIDLNLIAPTNQRTRVIYLKRGAVVRRNSDLSTNRNFGVRHGPESKFWANIIRSSYVHFSGALVYGGKPDHFHDIRGNDAPNADLILWCGSETAAPYQAASYALAASNRFRSIRVGVQQGSSVVAAQGGRTRGCKIFLDGKVPRSKVSLESCVKDTITIRDDAGGIAIPKTYPLTETMVGLETKGQGA